MKFTKTIGGNWIATVDGLTIVCEKIKTKTGWSRGRQLYRVTWKASTTIDGKYFATIHDTRKRAIQDLLEVEIGYAYLYASKQADFGRTFVPTWNTLTADQRAKKNSE